MAQTGKQPPREPARDVLAAEAFAMPGPDPELEPAHDVLAADEFAFPAQDPTLRRRAVALPGDPTGIEEPHDILAAEDFAMPAPPAGRSLPRAALSWRPTLKAAIAGIVGLVLLRRLRRS